MTRPCFTLTFLIAALGGSLMWATSARCQAPADEDYGGYGWYHTYSCMEEDAYGGMEEELTTNDTQLEDDFHQDLAGRAVVAVLDDPVQEEDVVASAGDDVFEAYAYEFEHDETLNAEEDSSLSSAEIASVTSWDEDDWACDPYGYREAYGDCYDMDTATTDTVEVIPDEPRQEFISEPVVVDDPAETEDTDVVDRWHTPPMTTYSYPYGYGYDYEYDWQKPIDEKVLETHEPSADPRDELVVLHEIDFEQLAELRYQLMKGVTDSELVSTIRSHVKTLLNDVEGLADHIDLAEIWLDMQASLAATIQAEAATEANTFLFEFSVDQDEAAVNISAADESPWMWDDEELLNDSDDRQEVVGGDVLGDEPVSDTRDDAGSQTLVWAARALNRLGMALQDASARLESYAASRPAVASAVAPEMISR